MGTTTDAHAADAALRRTFSDGEWGEGTHPVDITQVASNIQEARDEARSRAGTANSVYPPGKGPDDIEAAAAGFDGGVSDPSEFDLAEFVRSRAGWWGDKPLGLAWDQLGVYAPEASVGGGVFVKTFPEAVTNTFWKDPWNFAKYFFPWLAKVEPGNKGMAPILHPTSGVLRAGQMLLVLGRPGSGCTTFLRTLTTALSDKSLETRGDLTYGLMTPEMMDKKYRGEVVFVDEEDAHYPELTVAETLRFALRCKVPNRTARQGQTRSQFIETLIDFYLKIFAMPHVKDTIVGNEHIRGVSGGERKRVTIMESFSTRAAMIAFDNTTRGLDASTALDYARSMRIITDITQRTTVATLYQVSEQLYRLFQLVAVVDEGRVIYYGPSDRAKAYFYDLGYQYHEGETTADFVTAVTDPQQVIYREGYEDSAPKTALDREQAWIKSELNQNMLGQRDAYVDSLKESGPEHTEAKGLSVNVRSHKNKGVRKGSSFTVSYWSQVRAVLARQIQIKWAARSDFYFQTFVVIAVPLMMGSAFYQLPNDSSGVAGRSAFMCFCTLFVGWSLLGEIFLASSGQVILTRQKNFAFARPSATVVARAIVDMPTLMTLTTLYSIVAYFMAGFRTNNGAEAFFIFWIIVFLCSFQFLAYYRMMACVGATVNESLRYSILGLNTLFVFEGFVLPRPDMNWTKWLSYCQGLSYAFQALMANEFRQPIQCEESSVVPFGKWEVDSRDYLEDQYAFRQNRIGEGIGAIIAFAALYLIINIILSELLESNGGAGVAVFARTKHAKEAMKHAKALKMGQAVELPPSQQEPQGKANENTRKPSSEYDTSDTTAKDAVTTVDPNEKYGDKSIFTWENINLELDNGRKLLEDVTGLAKPGQLVALMGSSGAGKTTLLSALSQRINFGRIEGTCLVDGSPLPKSFQKSCGFVMQGDLHMATQTVREAIEFSALLRQPASIPRAQKMKDVDEILQLLDLTELQDALIGEPGKGLSIERRKRVTIAVELAAKPSLVLFLDEPTSGLDSAGAAAICRLLRRLAQQGQAIICTIHQPSEELFSSFDSVICLQRGGKTVYNGPIGDQGHIETDNEALALALRNTKVIRNYLEKQGAPPCPPDENVAEYLLELTSATRDEEGVWFQRWQASTERQALLREVEETKAFRQAHAREVAANPELDKEFTATLATQLREVCIRQLKDMWRDSAYSYSVVSSYIAMGLLVAGAFAHSLDHDRLHVRQLNLVVFLTLIIMLVAPVVIQTLIGKYSSVLTLYRSREEQSRLYSWPVLITSFIVMNLPMATFSSLVYWLPTFFIGFYAQPSWKAGYFCLMNLTVTLYLTMFALLICVISPTEMIAALSMPLFLPLLITVNGTMAPFHGPLPQPWKSIYWANPITYYIKGQLANIMHKTTVYCTAKELMHFNPPPGMTCGAYAGDWVAAGKGSLVNPEATSDCGYCQYARGEEFLDTFNAPYHMKWTSWGVLLCFTVGNLFLCYAGYWAHVKVAKYFPQIKKRLSFRK